jgi:hypothetical protein
MSTHLRRSTRSTKKGKESGELPTKTKDISKSKLEKEESKQKDSEQNEEVQCGICLEAPSIRGALDSCAHAFCFVGLFWMNNLLGEGMYPSVVQNI